MNTPAYINTAELARQLGINAQSIRTRLFRINSYFGIVPDRLPNRRLLWPAEAVTILNNLKNNPGKVHSVASCPLEIPETIENFVDDSLVNRIALLVLRELQATIREAIVIEKHKQNLLRKLPPSVTRTKITE